MFPLILVPIAAYNLLAAVGVPITTPILHVSAVARLSVEELLIIMTLVLLGVEIWRSTAPTAETAKNHVTSLLVCLASIFEYSVAPWCATGTFLILIVAAVVDTVMGTYISFITKGKNIWVSNR